MRFIHNAFEEYSCDRIPRVALGIKRVGLNRVANVTTGYGVCKAKIHRLHRVAKRVWGFWREETPQWEL